MSGVLPQKPRGRLTGARLEAYQAELSTFCNLILALRQQIGFSPSSRGWCYVLEEHGLLKGDFSKAQELLVSCRKEGHLPIDICARDGARATEGVLEIDGDLESEVDRGLRTVEQFHTWYRPFSFWDAQPVYLEVLVEKIDLKALFKDVCDQYYVPITNLRGWADVNSRADLMARMRDAEANGAKCVILYCGDHDPGGLAISGTLSKNLADLSGAVGWSPGNIVVDRFGLNYDFIERHELSWIENLETSSGDRLDDPRHKDHRQPYVQNYLRQFGARKVEANALIVRPAAAKELMRSAIEKYVSRESVVDYNRQIEDARDELRTDLIEALKKKFAA